MTDIPEDHPRYKSLLTRELLVKGVKDGIASMQGLIAQGRGEAFDYLLGERTTASAERAEKAAVAMMLLAKRPVISVNGNAAALVSGELVELSKALDAPLEVNLFHRTEERAAKIISLLKSKGAARVYGDKPDRLIPGLSHERAKAASEGIYAADVVLVPLEDGDRCEALVKMGKKVIVVDLNPMSRSARKATVTIVDNIVRAVPGMAALAREMKSMQPSTLEKYLEEYHNEEALEWALEEMMDNVKALDR
ncbi:MAG TPA: 4-phosphopantoate--beta-alanine ligase [Methanocella sp.]|uniref:4-phosphopantoate--beta-alanine ligase n=1 Tax=Methanocella sp. TaxID=2052833 RepID=UPI002B9C5390|nr:4-phosphopantoate--beta-alanine ligase [Methanocella sp.]HTY91096.1 4-phosphopantoate--beta-alanine ligase [Methanocella sp.]